MFWEAIVISISAIAALTGAAGGLWAARAAHRSAISADNAARHAEKIDRQGVLRDLITSCHRVIAESTQIGLLAEELKSEYRLHATFSGQSGSKREKLHILRVDSKQKEIIALQREAQQQIQEQARLLNASDEEFTESLIKFDGYLVQVLQIKGSLEREITSVAGNNRVHREGRIKGLHQRLHHSDSI